MVFVQVAFITDWFVGKNLNFALGVTSSLPLLGEIINAYVSPKLYEKHVDSPETKCLTPLCFKGYGSTFYVGLFLVITCFILVLVVIAIDYVAQHQLERMKKAWITISADKEAVEEVILEKPKFKFEDIKNFGAGFWLNCLSSMLQKNASMGYIMWIPIHFYKRYDFEHSEAGLLVCVPYAIMVILAPIMGIVVDKVGNNVFITTISCSMLVAAHLTLYNMFGTHHNPGDGLNPQYSAIIPICLIGISLTI
jgi:nitrate/nitrite transporter NarK